MDEILPRALTDIPILQSVDQQLTQIRMDLETVFGYLKIAYDAGVVCMVASKETDPDSRHAKVSSVLFNVVNHEIHAQMAAISSVIERLGGRTEFTEESEKMQDAFDQVNGLGKYASEDADDADEV